MMGEFANNLARLRVAAATGQAPGDLLRWAADVVVDLAPAAECVEARNVLLRRAGALVSGTRYAKARRLEREIRAISSPLPLHVRAADDGVRSMVAQALDVAAAPRSLRQLLTILGR